MLLKDGEVNGYLQVHGTLILSESGNEFTTRDCKVDFMDADRKVLDSDNDQVGSHQVSFLPGEEVSRVINDLSQRPFECEPVPQLRFDLCGI